jgi:hypothetical protein
MDADLNIQQDPTMSDKSNQNSDDISMKNSLSFGNSFFDNFC